MLAASGSDFLVATGDGALRLIEVQAEGKRPIQIGAGINTGEMIAGYLGSSRALEYTVIGDAVNVASRLESSTKELGVPVLASDDLVEAARRAAPDVDATVRSVGEIKVKGREAPVTVFTLA